MNIRETILKAADHIEAKPEQFDFNVCQQPDGCGSPGCAIGWIGWFLGYRKGFVLFSEVLWDNGAECDDAEFYDRMELFNPDWRLNADACAKTLRLYADHYHPEEFPEISKELSRIFKEAEWTPNSLANT